MGWLKDPLVAFLIAGAALFLLAGYFEDEDISYEIDVREPDLQRLSDQWQMQMRRPPNAQELRGLLDQWVKEEIYYREARRLGLDANDTIVRRRLVQKLTFLTEDIATAVPLDEATLQTFYDEHLENYQVPPRFSFQHRYFSKDRRDNASADAAAALTQPNTAGDPFMLQRQYAQRSEREIGDLFGREFAAQLARLDTSEDWQGPVESAYGWHTVRLTDKTPATVEAFTDVTDRVRIDAQQSARKTANAAYYQDLKARYQINQFTAASE